MLLRTLAVPAALVFLAACVEGEPSALVGPEDSTAAFRTAGDKGGGRPQPPADPVIVFLNFSRPSDDQLIVMNADGSNQTVIYSAPRIRRPSWSPGGNSIVFFRRNTETSRSPELWIVDVGIVGGKPQGTAHQLTSCGGSSGGLFFGCEPAWSPLGTEIAFTEGVSGEFESQWFGKLQVINMDNVNNLTMTEIYRTEEKVSLKSPTWSPDGKRIAVVEGVTTITILDLTTESGTVGVQKLLFDEEFQVIDEIDWAHTTEKSDLLAFSAVAIGGGEFVYILDISDISIGEISPVPTKVIQGETPTWSPDDGELAFIRKPQQILMSVDLSTLKTKRLAKDALDPDWARQTQQD